MDCIFCHMGEICWVLIGCSGENGFGVGRGDSGLSVTFVVTLLHACLDYND